MKLLLNEGIEPIPVFVNYGQLARDAEEKAFDKLNERFGIERRYKFRLDSFGANIRTGLTDSSLDIVLNAFTPNRNMLFLLLGASVAYQHGVRDVVMGLLAEETAIFPDQSDQFLSDIQRALTASLNYEIRIHNPLRAFVKKQVVATARTLGLDGAYSCHRGGDIPCGECIACREFEGT